MSEKCGALKHGVIDLRCSLDIGHDKPKDGEPGCWHQAVFTDRRQIDYPGAHHLVEVTETVTWQPSDPAEEAVRHMLRGAGRAAIGAPKADL